MKFDKMKLALAAIGLVNLSQVAYAGNSTSVAVSANVQGICKFVATSGSTMSFGTIDPTGTVAATASTLLAFQCTKSAVSAASITTGGTALVSGANTMAYTSSLASAAQTGAGFGAGAGTTLNMTLNGSIAVASFQVAAAGAYTDTIVVNITP